jgi:cytochrome c553
MLGIAFRHWEAGPRAALGRQRPGLDLLSCFFTIGVPDHLIGGIMRRKNLSVVAIFGLLAASGSALADAEAAKATATGVCAGCHGPNGISAADIYPNLAGQKKGYLVAALKAYRDKTRSNPMMNGMAASLGDQQIEDLAAYFSGLKAGQ